MQQFFYFICYRGLSAVSNNFAASTFLKLGKALIMISQVYSKVLCRIPGTWIWNTTNTKEQDLRLMNPHLNRRLPVIFGSGDGHALLVNGGRPRTQTTNHGLEMEARVLDEDGGTWERRIGGHGCVYIPRDGLGIQRYQPLFCIALSIAIPNGAVSRTNLLQ